MDERRAVLAAIVTQRWFVPLVVLLLALRFLASTITAYLGTRNVDTTALDAAVVAYELALQVALLVLILVVAESWPTPIRGRVLPLVVAGLSVLTAVIWFGTVDPSHRIFRGPLAGLALGLTATLAIAASGVTFDREIGTSPAEPSRIWFRVLVGGFAVAYLLRSLQLVDYAYVFGVAMPQGILWLFAFGPTVLVSAVAIAFWLSPVVVRSDLRPPLAAFLGPPLAGLLAGAALTLGIGGFILSNLFAWGGAYDVFSPTWVSLPFVGFAIGAFAAAGWICRKSVPRTVWMPLFGGVLTATLAGLQTLGGTVASMAGIGLGLALSGRALASWALLRQA